MRYLFAVAVLLFSQVCLQAQQTLPGLQKAFQVFLADAQLRYAAVSLYVIDAATGKTVLAHNTRLGLAPASTLKVVTSATALDMLGSDFRFKTDFSFDGRQTAGIWEGTVYIKAAGDPTLGSDRFAGTGAAVLSTRITAALQKAGIGQLTGQVKAVISNYDQQTIPDGWIYEDMGNYYGAGSSALMWKENQYDLVLKPGSQAGQPVIISRTEPAQSISFDNALRTGTRQSGDNAYIYPVPGTNRALVKGTVPCCVDSFVIAGAVLQPNEAAVKAVQTLLQEAGVLRVQAATEPVSYNATAPGTVFFTHTSPSLDSIVYWFNRKSINLYGEALLKQIARQDNGKADTEAGIKLLQQHWQQRGIDTGAIHIYDGSGLSPLDRITTTAQVNVLAYARRQSWYRAFYQSLPEYNGMKMKSGTISDVKGFCGYHRSRAGREYIFSFLVNNYSGSASSLTQKMYTVLNELK
ncbi:MAG: D-alanyl-D-alanine carboxypeptidase/D-alanyl-D-alanine-endopeptidase [Chitinophagaceae bacterium]